MNFLFTRQSLYWLQLTLRKTDLRCNIWADSEANGSTSDFFCKGLSLEVCPRPSLRLRWPLAGLQKTNTLAFQSVHPALSEKSSRNINTMRKWAPYLTLLDTLDAKEKKKRKKTHQVFLTKEHKNTDRLQPFWIAMLCTWSMSESSKKSILTNQMSYNKI